MRTPAKVLIGIVLATGIFLAGYLANRQEDPSTSSASGEQAVTYTCPMHPQYRSNRAGDCPICGMRLTRADTGQAGNKLNPVSLDTPGMVQISAVGQQLIGVRTDEVRLGPSSYRLRVPGRVAVDDQRLHRIIAAADGWIVDLEQNTVGSFVKKDQLLGSYYQKDLLYTERLFLLSIAANQPLPTQSDFTQASIRTSGSANPMFPIDSLRSLGMSDLQIEEIHKTRTASPHIGIYSPVSGFVLARDISPSQRFDQGTEMYRIADISRVWVTADVFEKDLELVKPGAMATVRSQAHELHARVSDILPRVAPDSRVLKIRLETDNPGFVLKPDMFVEVELPVSLPEAIVVPADAVIDSGLRKTIFVAKGDGYFEPRQVEIGWRMGGQVEITKGLAEGEQIVVSGNFLLDSESRMRMPAGQADKATEGPGDMTLDPVCGMKVDPAKAAGKSEYKGKTYYFCSDQCKREFDANTEAVLSRKAS